jgi:hypothetical protein
MSSVRPSSRQAPWPAENGGVQRRTLARSAGSRATRSSTSRILAAATCKDSSNVKARVKISRQPENGFSIARTTSARRQKASATTAAITTAFMTFVIRRAAGRFPPPACYGVGRMR